MLEHLIKGRLKISAFKNEGLEKLSMINKVIEPGETYTLNVGVIYDFYSDDTKNYSSFMFTSQLQFSNGENLCFGTGGNI